MTRTASFYTDAAIALFDAGFTSKSGQKAALSDLLRAYEMTERKISDKLLAVARDERDADWETLYWGRPDFHNWKPKHSALFAAFADEVAEIEKLVELRAAIKAAPINAPARKEPTAREIKVRETLVDMIERRKAQYLEAIHLGELFGGLPVSANSHWVVNEHNTRFLRTFFYLRGVLTPLNIIIAAAEELERRAEA